MDRAAFSLAKLWTEFRAAPPGRRFSEQHRRRRLRSAGMRAVLMAAGAAMVVLGAVLFFTPAPGGVLASVGAALLARESAAVAGMLDRIELGLRGLVARLRRAI